jgi:hypothetical protein
LAKTALTVLNFQWHIFFRWNLEFIQMKITFSTNLWIINLCHSPNQQMATTDIKKCYANTKNKFFFLFIHQLNYNFRFSSLFLIRFRKRRVKNIFHMNGNGMKLLGRPKRERNDLKCNVAWKMLIFAKFC